MGAKMFLIIFISRVGWTWGQENVLKHYTAYGKPCTGTCDTHGYGYIWCTTETGWDYCSITEFTDYSSSFCRDDHLCGKYGKSYTWCYTKAGSWGYCGLLRNMAELKTLSYTSAKYQSECTDECLYDENSKYFWCNTDKGWDYCSPQLDVTYKNEPCRSDHSCGAHGYGYTWCWTSSGYDYCGVISPGECQYSITGYNKDQANVTVLLCTQWKNGNKLETKFYPEAAPIDLADGSPWRNKIMSLIARWKNGYLTDSHSKSVVHTAKLCIDLQGLVKKEDQQYYQIVVMPQDHEFGRNTTVAQVLVPVQNAVPSRYVRKALAESFRRRARITLEVTTTQSH